MMSEVVVVAVDVAVLAAASFFDKAAFAIAGLRPLVEVEGAELDAVEVHLLEGEAKQRRGWRRCRSLSTSSPSRR